MGNPSWSRWPAVVVLFAGWVVSPWVSADADVTGAEYVQVARASALDGFVAEPTAHSHRPRQDAQCEQTPQNVAATCQVRVRVHHEPDMSPDIGLMLHRIDAQRTLESRSVAFAEGDFVVDDLAVGTYHLNLLGTEFETTTLPPLSCEGDNSRIYWERGLRAARGRVQGRLRGHDGRWVPGAELLLQKAANDGVVHVPIDSDGNFSLPVAPGLYQYVAMAPQHAARTGELRVPSAGSIHLPLDLEWRPTLRGRVTSADGRVVAGARVFLGPRYDPKTPPNVVLTQADGTFEIPVVKSTGLRLSALADDGCAMAHVSDLGSSETPSRVELRLQPGRTLEGWVQRRDGRPHASGEIRFRIKSLGVVGSGYADADGHFTIAGLPTGEDVELWAEGSAIGAWGAAVAPAGQNRVLLTYVPPPY